MLEKTSFLKVIAVIIKGTLCCATNIESLEVNYLKLTICTASEPENWFGKQGDFSVSFQVYFQGQIWEDTEYLYN